MTMRVEARRVRQVEGAAVRVAVRVAAAAAWLVVVRAAAPLVEVHRVDPMVPLVVLGTCAVLAALERRGAGPVGITLTVGALWLLAATSWGEVGGSVLLVSAGVVVSVPRSIRV
ncbi:hypothetical protein ACQP1V_42900 (plasmid) [Microtetraspora malaysiensis]|uniref:hypothetical protein n=1 Tax=Microtetraspora malaysiensis TaxID=161358 RepID=UPI003D94C875